MLPALRTSLSAVRENSWTPLEDLVAYMETTKAMLAPGDPDFYRKMGFYGGRHVRSLPVGIAVSEQMRALRLYGMLWRTFFDAGDPANSRFPFGALLLPASHRLGGGPPKGRTLVRGDPVSPLRLGLHLLRSVWFLLRILRTARRRWLDVRTLTPAARVWLRGPGDDGVRRSPSITFPLSRLCV